MKKSDLLGRIQIFSDLDGKGRKRVHALLRERKVRKGTIIFHQHDEGGGLFLIGEGEVKISRLGRDGREVIVALLRAGNFFGEMSLLDGQPRSATAIAASACRLYTLEKDLFLQEVLPLPSVSGAMLKELSLRIRAANQNIENLALGSVFDRLFHFLGHLGRRFPMEGGQATISRRPTHQELAEIIGATRETVTRSLTAMEQRGLITIRKREILLLPAFFEEERARSF